ncbi:MULTISPECIES: mandelate racemase/muconate lactonizing enzyme family protein [unclassified Variovorax]|uniref:mandelate racemase/muconate lactonizing enzyme family protein n=1 Tax=unclassified Variovorax TaxID=663243 RepID=UPI0025753A73|nr:MULTISPECIES: mandelate racemase/muconate lactonizing enzyme family protein [unclassified Variovorax]MDM0090986.1 mandelate racemase/muconate lactonizing enzyme family protein [Variovorax sp. J22G40]MDM0149012.1 mandelate racemase/muconate lactonizing enzyme family protein [Variovorax sp. J2P1-31]
MAKIDQVEIAQIDIAPKVVRTDAIQSFVTQETVMVTVRCDDGSTGTGYTYTIGTGGSSIVALLQDHLAPRLIGRDPQHYEAIWRDLFFHTHATAVGAITSLALAAVDTALWDRNARVAKLPLWQLAGGAQSRVPVYTTEGGWLQIPQAQLVEQTLAAQAAGFLGAKVKVGKPHVAEDIARLSAVRAAVGPGFELMVDANQSFTVSEAVRRARQYEAIDLAWFEEPMPAEHVRAHAQLLASTSVPVAVGESMYHLSQFAEYIQQGACSIVQADVARVGGITPWLKIAHLAEAHNIAMCPHFLMEIHVSLCAAVPNGRWVEYIPQLDDLTTSRLQIEAGHAVAPSTPGLGIEWDPAQLKARRKFEPLVVRG